MSSRCRSGAEPDSLVESVRRAQLPDGYVRCRWCSTVYRPHRWWADHADECPLRPMNRPHIAGVANAPGITLDLQEADFE